MRALLLVALVLVGGCVGRDDTPLMTADVAPTGPSSVEQPAAAQAPTPEGASASAPAPVETKTPFSWDGRTAGAVCVGAPVARCQIVSEPARTWTPLESLGAAGTPLRVRGTITWTAETPLTEHLRMFVFGLDAEGGMPLEGVETQGPSPLAFEVDLTQLDGTAYALSLHGHHEVGPTIGETPQAFHIELELTTRS